MKMFLKSIFKLNQTYEILVKKDSGKLNLSTISFVYINPLMSGGNKKVTHA